MKTIILGVGIALGVVITSCNVSRESNYEDASNARTAANPNSDYDRTFSSVSPRAEVESAYPQNMGNYNENVVYDTVLGPTNGRNYNNRRGKENFYEQAGDEKITVY